MIHNDREYEITKGQADKFAAALASADATNPGRSSEMQAILKAALASQLDDLRSELAEYDQRRVAVQNSLAKRAMTAVEDNVSLLKERIAAAAMPLGVFEHKGARAVCTSTSGSSVTTLMVTARSTPWALA